MLLLPYNHRPFTWFSIMKLKKALLVISICCWGLLFPVWNWGIIPPAEAAKTPVIITPSEEVSQGVDQFIHKLPRDYYNINKVAQVKKLSQSDRALFIDVREPSEYRQGHIQGAINIPLRTLTERLDDIPHDRQVVIYCSSGYRTGIAVASLQLLGYNNIKGFAPSINAWKEAGEPLEK